MNLAQHSFGLVLLASLVACDDSVGSIACVGAETVCEPIPPNFDQGPSLFDAPIERVPASPSGSLSIAWRKDLCPHDACAAWATSGPDQSAWLVLALSTTSPNPDPPLGVRRYDADGELESEMEIQNPDAPNLAGFSAPTSDARGRLFTHVQWFGAKVEQKVTEVLRVDEEGKVARHPIPWTAHEEGVTHYGVVPGVDSFEVIESVGSNHVGASYHVLRSYTETGELAWQQSQLLPRNSGSIVMGGVRTESGLALVSSFAPRGRLEDASVLFTDAFGNAISGLRVNGQNAPMLRALAHDQVALALMVAEDEPILSGLPDGDILLLKLDRSGELSGHGLQRTAYHDLTMYAFTSDPAGDLFLSTQAGARDVLVGMVCRVTVDGDARCFEGEPNVTFGSLVALDEHTLFAVTRETRELLRIELP